MTQASTSAPTPFQGTCLDELVRLANSLSATVEQIEWLGQHETYAVVTLSTVRALKLSAWIYADECMLTAGEKSFYFEKPDYPLSKDLTATFLAAVSDLLQERPVRQLGSSRINLFRSRRL